jgi:hypothetical protein
MENMPAEMEEKDFLMRWSDNKYVAVICWMIIVPTMFYIFTVLKQVTFFPSLPNIQNIPSSTNANLKFLPVASLFLLVGAYLFIPRFFKLTLWLVSFNFFVLLFFYITNS